MKWIQLFFITITLTACNTKSTIEKVPQTAAVKTENRSLTSDFKAYWHDGRAEISSYTLQQARYGEMREGTAVLVFVTEPMDAQSQIKADVDTATNIPVMKLNATRNFNTGIYPYTMMSSTFLPLDKNGNALKVAGSIQEWCGHTYMQLNNRDAGYHVQLYSYFQSEGNTQSDLENAVTENQLAAQLRIDPMAMPTGTFKIIPSVEYLRLKHVKTDAYEAIATLTNNGESLLYQIEFPALDRVVRYTIESAFPYKILAWTDQYKDGDDYLETTATIKKTIKSAYWNKNSNSDAALRDSLSL